MQLFTILSLASLPVLATAALDQVYQGWNNGSYRFYRGDGSAASGWPAITEWANFDAIWTANSPFILQACFNLYSGLNITIPNSDPILELPLLHLAISLSAQSTKIDPRFILAIILAEIEGCVRAKTAIAPGDASIFNPGLMQIHQGNHSCNRVNGTIITPCPQEQILGMVQDGAAGTAGGDGLGGCLNEALSLTFAANSTEAPPPKTEAQAYYMAARLYNSGNVSPDGNLDNAEYATGYYCSDIANRLMGWTNGDLAKPRTCCLDTTCPVTPIGTVKMFGEVRRGVGFGVGPRWV